MLRKAKLGSPVMISSFLALAVLAIYLPVTGFDFICYDDPDYVTANPPVLAGVTLEGVRWAFARAHAANWHPLTWLSHMLDCQLYGMQAGGHHLTNVVFHIANTVLLFLFLRSLTAATWRSALVAALFGLHPLHVESVAWVSERKDVLSTFFGLLSLWCYARYVMAKSRVEGRGPRGGVPSSLDSGLGAPSGLARMFDARRSTLDYFLALIFFALGLMSKPMLVTLPFVFLLLDYWPLRRLALPSLRDSGELIGLPSIRATLQLLLEKLPFFALVLASSVTTYIVQKIGGAVSSLTALPFPLRVATALVAYADYIGKSFWPTHLAAIYPYPSRWPFLLVAGAAAMLIILSAVFVRYRARHPYLLVGWLWYLGTLVPVIGLVQVGNQPMADRYTYLPAVGLFVMVAWGLAELVANRSRLRWLAVGPGVVAVLVCALVTRAELRYWRNSETLFRHAIAVTSSGNPGAHNLLGVQLASRHQTDEAMNCYQTALKINPRFPPAWNNIGCLLIDQGRYEEAITNCETALRLDPSFAEAHNNLATALVSSGRFKDASEQYSKALQLRPDYAQAHYNFANALAGQGQIASAAEHYRAALRSSPGWASAHNNLGFMLIKESKPDEAVAEFRLVLAQDPGMWEAHFGLAAAYAGAGNTSEAILAAGRAYDLAQAVRNRDQSEKSRALLENLKSSRPSAERPASTAPAPARHQ